MKQLVLELQPDSPPTFSNFVCGANGELLRALHDAICGATHVYLWGPPGSGRTHLLHATAAAAIAAGRPAAYLDAREIGPDLPQQTGQLLAVDDLETLGHAGRNALFNAFNRSTALQQTLVIGGASAPRGLDLREDLRTRIGQCLVFEVRPLDDATRTGILETLAERRGLRLQPEVVEFLLRHGRRDLRSLVAAVDALDRASLEHKRPATLPLLRTLMQAGLDI